MDFAQTFYRKNLSCFPPFLLSQGESEEGSVLKRGGASYFGCTLFNLEWDFSLEMIKKQHEKSYIQKYNCTCIGFIKFLFSGL